MFKSIKNVIYHILILILSAAVALSLPYTGKFIADNYLVYWALIEREKLFLISVEVAVAVLLIMLFSYLVRSWNDRKFSQMALNDMGLVYVAHRENHRIRKRLKKFKEQEGTARDLLLIGSTGWTTFVKPEGDLHRVVQDCREAKIMLLNPCGEGAFIRAKSIPDPDVTPEHFREQIENSLEFLKSLKSLQKNIKLKLYEEAPLLKLAVLGDYVFMKHYHSGLNVREMPECVFRHSSNHCNLFHPLYQFFLSKWRDPRIPEYDFDTEELIYRDSSRNEINRKKLGERMFDVTLLG